MVKYLIIGAGPAGIQMGHLLKDQDYLILEKSDTPCSFFRNFPRQRRFISINKSRNLRLDWNSFLGDDKSFRDYSEELYPSADDYLRYVDDFVQRHDIKIRFGYEVKSIEKKNGRFLINNELDAEFVFFGIGVVPKEPDFPVHESIKVFTYQNMPLDKEVYRDKNVWIIGNGNAALETADYIAPICAFTVLCGRDINAWKTHYPGHARSKNFTSIDSYFLKVGTGYMFDQDNNVKYTDSEVYQIVKSNLKFPPSTLRPIDIVIFCTGFKFDDSLVKHLVDVDKFPVLSPHFESPKCENLFFIGATSQQHDYKKGTSAFIHGFRYNCEYITRYLLGFKNTICIKPHMIMNIMKQINQSSSLFHRFDYFCDLIGMYPDKRYEYVKEIPIASVREYVRPEWIKYFTVRLGYINQFEEHFHQKTFGHPRDAHRCKFIHPIFETEDRLFHLPENIFNDYLTRDFHYYPLTRFVEYFEGNISWQQMKDDINAVDGKDNGGVLINLLTR